MTTLFIGSEELAHQYAYLAYSKVEEMLSFGKVLSCQIDPSRLPNIEVIAVRVERPFTAKFLKQSYLLLPDVKFELDLRSSIDDIIKRMSRRRRRDIKKLESSIYSYSISRKNEKDFDLFYWKMHLPYTRNRFEKAAYITPYLEAKAFYIMNGGIIFVKKEQTPVAGTLFQIRGETLYALRFGVYERDQNLVDDLASQATLFFLIKWAENKGIKSLNYGGSLPFLRTGLFMYKKEWGMNVEEQTSQSICALKLNSLSEGSLSFLRENPFIFLDKGVLKGVVVVNHKPTKVELQQIFSRHFIPKLDSIIVIAYYSFDTEVTDTIESLTTSQNLQDALVEPLSNICLLLLKRGLNVKVLELRSPEEWKTIEFQSQTFDQ